MKSSNFICTLGPTNNTQEQIERMIFAGMSVARLNMIHGTHEGHQKTINNVRLACESYRGKTNYHAPVAIALDLLGQEMKIGKIHKDFEATGQKLQVNDTFKLTHSSQFIDEPSRDMVYLDTNIIDLQLRKKHEVFLDNGTIEMYVDEIHGGTVACKVTKGGTLKSCRNVFVPGIKQEFDFSKVTEKDKLDIEFAIENDVDFIFASQVENGKLIDEIKVLIEQKGKNIEIYAKIQNLVGLEALDEILEKVDGIIFKPTMEINTMSTSLVQNLIFSRCQANFKPLLIPVNEKLKSTALYQVTNWMCDSGDGLILTHAAAYGKISSLESMKVLEKIRKIFQENSLKSNDEDENEIDFKCSEEIGCALASVNFLVL